MSNKTGILFLNLGTPDRPETAEVRRYLRQFLNDPRVIDIPAVGRWLLLNLFILPFRPQKSAIAYRAVWTEKGSPLLWFSQQLGEAIQGLFGENIKVRIAMRYQNPSISKALAGFKTEGVDKLIIFPLYPQYASSSTGSCLEVVYREVSQFWNVPSLMVIPPYYDHPKFITSLATVTREALNPLETYDRFLFSFHGLPERQIKKSDLDRNGFCLRQEGCCAKICDTNQYCYRAQSFATARSLASTLGIGNDRYEVGFQSRLGRSPWIQPYTDLRLKALATEGVRKLAVVVPSFASDCLETIEEIGIRGKNLFLKAGGQQMDLVPCLNAHPSWVTAVEAMLKQHI